MTPRLFDALIKRKEVADRQEFLRTGIIAAAVVNFSMCHPEKPVSALDYVPGAKAENNTYDLSKMSPEEQQAHIIGQLKKKVTRRRRG